MGTNEHNSYKADQLEVIHSYLTTDRAELPDLRSTTMADTTAINKGEEQGAAQNAPTISNPNLAATLESLSPEEKQAIQEMADAAGITFSTMLSQLKNIAYRQVYNKKRLAVQKVARATIKGHKALVNKLAEQQKDAGEKRVAEKEAA